MLWMKNAIGNLQKRDLISWHYLVFCNFFYLFLNLILKNLYTLKWNYFLGVWNQLAEYLFLKKKDPNRPKDKWIGYMHGINRISIFVFILCLIILAVKLLTWQKLYNGGGSLCRSIAIFVQHLFERYIIFLNLPDPVFVMQQADQFCFEFFCR